MQSNDSTDERKRYILYLCILVIGVALIYLVDSSSKKNGSILDTILSQSKVQQSSLLDLKTESEMLKDYITKYKAMGANDLEEKKLHLKELEEKIRAILDDNQDLNEMWKSLKWFESRARTDCSQARASYWICRNAREKAGQEEEILLHKIRLKINQTSLA